MFAHSQSLIHTVIQPSERMREELEEIDREVLEKECRESYLNII